MSKSFLVLGLGSNIQQLSNLREALHQIKISKVFELVEVSRIYESVAQVQDGAEAQPFYLNAAVKVEVHSSEPQKWLLECQRIEERLGRTILQKRQKWEARTIDVDILYASDGPIQTENLSVPHPLLFERPFALLPMLEVFSDFATMQVLPDWALNKWMASIPFQTQVSKTHFWIEFISIMNMTQDSFSDGGKYLNADVFLQQVELHLQQGAQVIEIGAESTRPREQGNLVWDAEAKTSRPTQLELKLEFDRLNFALQLLSRVKESFKTSVDCRNPEVLADLIGKYRIDYINDVTGFRNAKLFDLASASSCQLISMHSLSVPVVKGEHLDDSKDPILILNDWMTEQVQKFKHHRIDLNRVIFDPGIGFGKTAQQSWHILNNLDQLQTHGCRLLVGHSRKSFLQKISDLPASERDPASALVTANLKRGFYDFLRVHELSFHKSALILS